jgi:excinuclease UvrABC ATPase subunit
MNAEFVGARACGKCHPSAYQAWKSSPHSRAHAALPKENVKDPRCMRCHGDGDADLGAVQCESCHGAGRYYARRNVMRDTELSRIVGLIDVTEEVCRRCHTDAAPNVQTFDQERMWGHISHGREAKAPENPSK